MSAGGAPQAGLAVQLLDLRNLRRTVTTTTGSDGRFAFSGDQRPQLFAVLVCETGNPCRGAPQARRTVKRYVGPAGTAYSLPALTRYFESAGASPAVAVGTITTVRPASAVVAVRNGSIGGSVSISGLTAPVRQGSATVRGLAPGRHLATVRGQRKVFTVGAGRTAHVTFGVRLATVTGRVVTGGRPRAGVPVALEGGRVVPRTTRTGSDGRYAFRLLLADPLLTYRLRVGMSDQAVLQPGHPKAYRRFTLSPGQVRRVDVVAGRGSRGAIDVTIEGGATPKRPAYVSLLSPTGSFIARASVEDRSVRLDGLAPGTYRVYAQWTSPARDRRVNSWRTVTVRRGAVTPALLAGRSGPGSITVTADPGNEVTITSRAPVIDPADPEAGDLYLRRYRTLTGTDTTTFDDLPAGTYLVEVSDGAAPGDQPEPVSVVVRDGDVAVDLDARPRQGSLSGRMVDPATGDPWPWTGQVVGHLSCSGSSDGGTAAFPEPEVDLEVHLVDLVGGDYACIVHHLRDDPGTPYALGYEQSLPVQGTVRVTPGQETVVDLPVPFAAVG